MENLSAEGFGTLSPLPPHRQTVEGLGIWKNGGWRVVIRRALVAGTDAEVSFPLGGTVRVAFAVWDGGAGDRDGKKLVTYWQTLALE